MHGILGANVETYTSGTEIAEPPPPPPSPQLALHEGDPPEGYATPPNTSNAGGSQLNVVDVPDDDCSLSGGSDNDGPL